MDTTPRTGKVTVAGKDYCDILDSALPIEIKRDEVLRLGRKEPVKAVVYQLYSIWTAKKLEEGPFYVLRIDGRDLVPIGYNETTQAVTPEWFTYDFFVAVEERFEKEG